MLSLLSNSRYLVIVLLSLLLFGYLLFFGSGALSSREGDGKISERIESELEHQPDEELHVRQPPLIYIKSLPAFKIALHKQMQPVFDTGITTKMIHAESDYIESLTGILVTLAKYYSPKQFGDQTPQEFISEVIESRFRWHNAVVEPLGPMTGGKIAQLTATAGVTGDVEKMIEEMVFHLYFDDILEDNFNYNEWLKAWDKGGFTPEKND